MMNCSHYEELLPALLDNTLEPVDASAVREHVAGCASCRASLESYERLENVLVARRDEVPSLDGLLPQATRLVAGSHARLRRFFDVLYSVPGLTLTTLGTIAMALFFYRDVVTSFVTTQLANAGQSGGFSIVPEGLLTSMSSANVWTMVSLYGVLTIAVVWSMGYMTARFVRE